MSAIDCPEKGPAYGKRVKQAASDLAFGREVTVQTYAHDKYQRTLGDVILSDGMNLYQELVKQSWLVVSEVCVVEYGAGAVRS